MELLQSYLGENKQRFLDELLDLLRIPSVSADSKYREAVFQTADFVADQLRKAGADNVEVCQTAGYPVVYGEK